uniref:Uncharacterized protein n=1 Tax=Chromera velia CCMP2878 TaxID=1169474 RepID=A0A0G4G1X2_9ALVE|eukprot:Cvel_4072.t1-p1 / transcript=Cvel_4072.t1 / gene=Cvel_4072 / organism=Chromera_velia_CCMP2878 / gene_product=hypothetical protein / transcript_product=hypothetical protein / location=Cvel_scaffold173:93523-96759(+) / protein_length=147 / sequence_SO=supercontig / SO=protein_coding / is_pseudo=false
MDASNLRDDDNEEDFDEPPLPPHFLETELSEFLQDESVRQLGFPLFPPVGFPLVFPPSPPVGLSDLRVEGDAGAHGGTFCKEPYCTVQREEEDEGLLDFAGNLECVRSGCFGVGGEAYEEEERATGGEFTQQVGHVLQNIEQNITTS